MNTKTNTYTEKAIIPCEVCNKIMDVYQFGICYKCINLIYEDTNIEKEELYRDEEYKEEDIYKGDDKELYREEEYTNLDKFLNQY